MNIITVVLLIIAAVVVTFMVSMVIDPLYALIFKKPLFLHWYPFINKLRHEQRQILLREFPFYRKLSDKNKVYFEHRVKAFLLHYRFVGRENLVVTQEMKILVAATYIMLSFGMRRYLINVFRYIILYPGTYYSVNTQQYHKGEYSPKNKAVVLSWADFLSGLRNSNDNINLGLHEFGHALHLNALKSNDTSAAIFTDEFNKILQYYKDHELQRQLVSKNYFREYAYENQFEFLAVLLEHFFETPDTFKSTFPELYHNVKTMINYEGE
ncbi:zinc-dependent peptidase [Flavobacterium kingsejongi]|uniref:DgsA anti-repressor MtfA n=1 Tax=Flavobacterium kingsejongi TaxID=1678728 RepID=A0A2S1LJI9_9FLAO|nr:zinc-dependent peptidase [Flavobacterium kingsejongi]AWG23918.1 hypothetical protein FK004_01110 [Flavobacterium kingsejongi]